MDYLKLAVRAGLWEEVTLNSDLETSESKQVRKRSHAFQAEASAGAKASRAESSGTGRWEQAWHRDMNAKGRGADLRG